MSNSIFIHGVRDVQITDKVLELSGGNMVPIKTVDVTDEDGKKTEILLFFSPDPDDEVPE
jgi:hypothetical protein